jgi:hydrogenase nickel incorporation protein HypA/HybF
MHELGITQEIVAIAARAAKDAKVRRVVVEIGRFTAVLPDAIAFCFDLCAQGSVVDGARLEIVQIDGQATCRTCQTSQTYEQPFAWCACGSSDLEWTAGDELKVQYVEVY